MLLGMSVGFALHAAEDVVGLVTFNSLIEKTLRTVTHSLMFTSTVSSHKKWESSSGSCRFLRGDGSLRPSGTAVPRSLRRSLK